MIDQIGVPPQVHVMVGMIVLVATLASFLVALVFALRKQALPTWTKALFIVAQLALMTQVLIGIKLLDQGAGFSQLYIHYLGGLAPLAFFLLMYWFPRSDALKQGRVLALVTGATFVFAFMAFSIGSAYANRAIS